MRGLLPSGRAFECRSQPRGSAGNQRRAPRACDWSGRTDPAIRLRVADAGRVAFDDLLPGRQVQNVSKAIGDLVLRRADGLWAYRLAVVVDDAAQRVTDLARGRDLLDSTCRQILLQRALGLPTPRHAHLPLVRDAAGCKRSRSGASRPVDPAQPLPALHAACSALGRDIAHLRVARTPDAWLRNAIAAFDPGRISRGSGVTAAHHTGVTNAD